MQEILLIGGGGHCKSVIDVIENEGIFEISGIVDRKELIGSKVLGYEVIGCDDDLEELSKSYQNICITVGQIKTPVIRVKLFTLCKKFGFHFPLIISTRAYVSKYAKVAEGTVIMHDVVINAGSSVGKNCIINTKALVEHDSCIGDNCHVSTGAIVNGNVNVGENCFLGSDSVVIEGAKIESNSFIKAGSLVK